MCDVQKLDLGSDGEYAKCLVRIQPLGGKADHRDERNTGGGRGVVIPPVVAEMDAAGLHPILQYISRRQATIVEKVACRPIYELFVKAERIL